MVNLFRKYQQPLMIVITTVIIIAFVWLYNGTQFERAGADRSYRIYEKALSQADIERTARRFQLAQGLGLNEFIMGLTGNAQSREQAMENFVWNSFVLAHQAKKLGIVPLASEVAEVFKSLPAFQTNNQFDPTKYQEFRQNVLTPNGFSDAQLEDLVGDSIRLKKLMELVGSTVDVTPAEFRELYTRNNEKSDVSLIRYKLADFKQNITPTNEEIAKYYEDHLPSLNTEEKRKVSYVEIALSEEEKKLSGRERMEALKKQSDRAEDFSQALLEKDATFASAAKKSGLEVKTTSEFTASNPPAEFASIPKAAATAFQLTEEVKDSNPIESEHGLVILHLDQITPKRPLTLEEARPQVVESIKNERGHNALVAKANETRAKINEALKAGKSFAEAAASAGANVESFPAFSPAEPAPEASAMEIASKTAELPVGGLSDLVPTLDGGVLVYLNKREPIDEAKLAAEQKTQMEGFRSFKRYIAFNEWLQLALKEANPHSTRPAKQEQEG